MPLSYPVRGKMARAAALVIRSGTWYAGAIEEKEGRAMAINSTLCYLERGDEYLMLHRVK